MEKPKILIVDDLVDNLISLELLLGCFDVIFVRATSGMEALIKTQREEFAMAILDVQMPGMDGYETLSLMRKRKKTKFLPVIFVSAIHQSDIHIIKGIETGAVDFIPKPIIPEILIGKVKIFLDLHSQKQQLKELLLKFEENNKELKKQKIKAEEATKAKSMFLANMSHEIRTPLNGIIGISKVIEKTELKNDQKELVDIITASGESLLNIVNNILDFSKIESGQIELENIEFNILNSIKTIEKLMKFKAAAKDIDLIVNVDKNIPDILLGDPYRLNQVLTNLANNALKFTEKGYVKIDVGVERLDSEKVDLLFTVSDTGIGISKKGRERLFKEYVQTENSTTRKYGGTGLGLSICQKLVGIMKGRIGVRSEEGKGSVFWVRLQFKYRQKEKKDINVRDIDIPLEMKVLYAEDNAVNQKVTQLLLSKIGVNCDIAVDGMDAFNKFKLNNYDIILMDMQMPDIDGLESTRMIRKFEIENNVLNPVYIAAVTANVFSEDKQKCLDSGMDDFISKPFNLVELKEIIKNAIRSSK